jgi:hypothetical protein
MGGGGPTKSALFLPLKMTNLVDKLTRLYVNEVVKLHKAPISILFDRDPRFISHHWPNIQNALGTKLNLNTAFHPQTNGHLERTIQILNDLLRSCVLKFRGNYEDHLPLMEFTYNNNYQAMIRMALYKTLYGWRCQTLICWEEVRDMKLMEPELVKINTKKVKVIREKMKANQDRKISYSDNRRRPFEFEVENQVFLKVVP